DAVNAERALLHHARIVVELPRAIGAGPGAELAADTEIGIHQHDAVALALVGGAGRADGDAGRLFAVQAGAWEVHGAAIGAFAGLVTVHAVEPHAARRRAIGIVVRQRTGYAAGVPFLAGDRTSMAADTGVEIDHQAELPAVSSLRQIGHATRN